MRITSVFRSDIRSRGASRRLADWSDHGAAVAALAHRLLDQPYLECDVASPLTCFMNISASVNRSLIVVYRRVDRGQYGTSPLMMIRILNRLARPLIVS